MMDHSDQQETREQARERVRREIRIAHGLPPDPEPIPENETREEMKARLIREMKGKPGNAGQNTTGPIIDRGYGPDVNKTPVELPPIEQFAANRNEALHNEGLSPEAQRELERQRAREQIQQQLNLSRNRGPERSR